jgi:3-phenylpropionate/trans-cinnamate dioxygenase ferredoxin subunit
VTEVHAAALADVPPGQPVLVTLNGTRVVLARVGDQVYALGDSCTHSGGPLSEGRLTGTRLACPYHGWMFDVRTGHCLLPSRGAAVPRYPARVSGDQILVELP